jgi:hypothetical protein
MWESFDAGVERLEKRKAELINDTLETYNSLEEAKAAAAVELAKLEADTVESYKVKVAANEAYDAALESAKTVDDAYFAAVDNYNTFNRLIGYTTRNHVASSGWIRDNSYTYNNGSGTVITATANVPVNYTPGDWIEEEVIYEDTRYVITVILDLDYWGTGIHDYLYTVYQLVIITNPTYSSVEDYEHNIELLKQVSVRAKDGYYTEGGFWVKGYDALQRELNDSVASLKLLAAEERQLYKEFEDSVAYLEEAKKALTTAYENYVAANDKFAADPTPANLTALDIARTAYEGLRADNSVVAAANGGALGARNRAQTYRDNAHNKYYSYPDGVYYRYDILNNKIKSLVIDVVDAKAALVNANLTLAEATRNLETLKKFGANTTREKLLFAFEAAEKAREDLYATDEYKDAIYNNSAANATHSEKVSAYNSYTYQNDDNPDDDLAEAQTAYDAAKVAYADVTFIEAQLELGGLKHLQERRAAKIETIKAKILNYNVDIELNKEQLKNVTQYAQDITTIKDEVGNTITKAVAEVIVIYKERIAIITKNLEDAKADQEKAKKLADYYKDAIDAFLTGLSE